LFARPEAYLFYFYVKFTVVGVILFSIFVGLAGEDSVTAVLIAAWQHNERSIVSGKDDIGKPPRVKRITVKPKTVVDMA
jgi:hypothetical protein